MATKMLPTLPNEIWAKVLENLCGPGDRTDAWTAYRHVSQSFKNAIEKVFRETHLPKTSIDFPLGREDYDDDVGKLVFNAECEFSRLSDDKNTAIFTIDAGLEEYHDRIRQRLKEAVETRCSTPPHYVQVRHDVNDTPIPGMQIDYQKFELSCDWRGLYTCFYGEEAVYNKLTQNWVKAQESRMLGIRAMIESGTMDMGKAFEQALGAFAKGSDENRKIARRARIVRQTKEKEDFGWNFEKHGDKVEEQEIMKNLAQRRQWASLEEYSDESASGVEDSDEDGDGEEDEDQEEDEWEDDEDDEDEGAMEAT